jgi:hypothetical protein
MIAVAVLVWLVEATKGIAGQGKLSQVHEHDTVKDGRSAGQRRSDTDHENAATAGRLMRRSPAGGDVVAAA